MPKHPLFVPAHTPLPKPGVILLNQFLKPLDITITEFAERIQMTRAAVSEIINGRRGITALTAMRFARALGTSEELWLNMQLSADIFEARHSPAAQDIKKIKPFA